MVLQKALSAIKFRNGEGKEQNDSEKLQVILDRELVDAEKHKERLRNRYWHRKVTVPNMCNCVCVRCGVLSSQIRLLGKRLRTDASAAEESGPVDIEQLRWAYNYAKPRGRRGCQMAYPTLRTYSQKPQTWHLVPVWHAEILEFV